MDVEYKNWESGKGLEEIQAKIYTEVSGLPARPEEIAPRNDERGTDMTQYALTKDGVPLAYVTSWESGSEPGDYGIGYPWSMPNCPKEVKMKIFNDQLNYIKSKKGKDGRIRTAVVLASKTADAQIEFFKRNGFVDSENAMRYEKDFDVKKLSKLKIDDKSAKLKSKIATKDDVDTLIELTKSDARLGGYFQTDEAAKGYFEGRVLQDGHCVILYDGDTAVLASALLKRDPDNFIVRGDKTAMIPRFISIRPGYQFAFNRLMIELALEAIEAKWQNVPLRIGMGFTTEDYGAALLSQNDNEMVHYELIMTFQGD